MQSVFLCGLTCPGEAIILVLANELSCDTVGCLLSTRKASPGHLLSPLISPVVVCS